MNHRHHVLALAALIGSIVLLPGCATVPKDPQALAAYRATNDPLEPLNRKTFALNQQVDRFVLKSLARGYVKLIPARGRSGISNIIANLHEPVVLGNNLLQLRFKRAGITLSRFVINSTVGIAGIMDFASRHKLPKQTGDFGQTLWRYGVHEGPYLIIPVFGPTSPRDGIGEGVDLVADPWVYLTKHAKYRSAISLSRTVVGGIDLRARNLDVLDELQRESIDFYAAMRSLYRQNRVAELNNGVAPPQPKAEDLYADPDAPASAPAPATPSTSTNPPPEPK